MYFLKYQSLFLRLGLILFLALSNVYLNACTGGSGEPSGGGAAEHPGGESLGEGTGHDEAIVQEISDHMLVHVVKPISGQKILPYTGPISGEQSTTLEMTASRGEYEPASFVLRPLNGDIENLSIEATPLTHGANIIPADEVDIRTVKTWYQGFWGWNEMGRWKDDWRQQLMPELLLHDDALVRVDYAKQKNHVKVKKGPDEEYIHVNPLRYTQSGFDPPWRKAKTTIVRDFPVKDESTFQPFLLKKGENKQLWITVHVPENVQPGLYEGRLRFKSKDRALGQITLKLRVLPFELAKSRLEYSVYYRAQLNPQKAGSASSEYKTREQMKNELISMWNHGLRNPTVYQQQGPFLEEVLRLRQEVGMTNQALYYLGITTKESIDALRRDVPKILDLARKYGATDVYIYGIDEASGDRLTSQRAKWKALHQMGAKVFVAGSQGSFEAVGDLLDLSVFSNLIDDSRLKKPLSSEAAKWHSEGKRIFSYSNPFTAIENPRVYRINKGLALWAADYDGTMPYAYQDCQAECWNDLAGPTGTRDLNLAYPTVDGVIDTLAMEGFREGVDDTRYLTTLEEHVQRVMEASGDTQEQEAASRATEFLKNLKNTIFKLQHESSKYNVGMKIDLDDTRSQIIDHILALTNNNSLPRKDP